MEIAEQLTEREKVERLERVIGQLPPVECPTRHFFAPGVFLREMLVPAGVIATGAVHKTEHLTIVAGHCLLTTDEGPKEFIGFHTIHSKPGAKRAISAISDTFVTTIHANPDDETDVAVLAERFTESKASELLGGAENRQRLAQDAREALL